MSAANTDQMLTRREVESMICVSCATIYRWVQEGTFPGPVKFTARCVRWRQSEVQNWIDSHTQVAA
jgi:prophage regulatory protein